MAIALAAGVADGAAGNLDWMTFEGLIAIVMIIATDLKFKFVYAALVALAGSLMLLFSDAIVVGAIGLLLTAAMVILALPDSKTSQSIQP